MMSSTIHHATLTSDLVGKRQKKTKEELEKDIPENCHVVRTNSVVRIAKF